MGNLNWLLWQTEHLEVYISAATKVYYRSVAINNWYLARQACLVIRTVQQELDKRKYIQWQDRET